MPGGGQGRSEEPGLTPDAPSRALTATTEAPLPLPPQDTIVPVTDLLDLAAKKKAKKAKPKKKPAKPRKKVVRKAVPGLIQCRACGEPVAETLLDLGVLPLREHYHSADDLIKPEVFYPLHSLVCTNCFLVQLRTALPLAEQARVRTMRLTEGVKRTPDNRRFCRTLVKQLRLGPSSLAVEISNEEGGFIQHLADMSVPVLGIEPVEQLAHRSIEKGLPMRVEPFGERSAKELAARGKLADVIFATNAMAQADDLRDLMAGIVTLLKPRGIVILEFPYLERLISDNQIDGFQHELVNYFCLSSLDRLAGAHRLKITDVQELPGTCPSLRVLLTHSASTRPLNNSVAQILGRERKSGLCDLETYSAFAVRIKSLKRRLLSYLISTKSSGQTVACFGWRGGGSTLLHSFGVGPDFVDFVIDADKLSRGKYTPGLHIPVVSEETLRSLKPDFLLVLPCSTLDEAAAQVAVLREWGGKVILVSPDLAVIDSRSIDR